MRTCLVGLRLGRLAVTRQAFQRFAQPGIADGLRGGLEAFRCSGGEPAFGYRSAAAADTWLDLEDDPLQPGEDFESLQLAQQAGLLVAQPGRPVAVRDYQQ
ncbi:hypothetical protein D9M71_710360 [compost metagenome]